MRRLIVFILLASFIGCGPPVAPLQPNLNFNISLPPLPVGRLDLDGQWVLANVDGTRSCLVIQESRVSILNLTCSADGRGFVARIISSPPITRAGNTIALSVTYNPLAFDDLQARLAFTGAIQLDGSFLGTRRDEIIGSTDGPSVMPASLSPN